MVGNLMQKQLVTRMKDSSDNFYFMINPYFPTDEIMNQLKNDLLHLIRYYPSNQKVISEKVKRLENVTIPLLTVNGSCEAIRILLQNYSTKALVTVPNFNEWEISNHVPIPYNATTDEIRQAIQQHEVDTVCFCNPNNPIGLYRDDIQQLVNEFPHVKFAIDISFIDFVAETIPELPKGTNVILIKSLGKNYGICGIRLGYIASEDEDLINDFVKKIPIWNINSVTEALIDLLLDHKEEYEQSRIRIIQGTRKMVDLLKQIPYLKVFPTKANFVMVQSTKPITHFNVKSCDNKTGLDGTYYRVAYNENYERLKELLQ